MRAPQISDTTNHTSIGEVGSCLKRYAPFVFLLFYCVAYIVSIAQHSVNMPKADDFDMLISTVLEFSSADTWSESLQIILRKHGEHYVVVPKLVAILLFKLLGSVNFSAIIIVGNFAVIAVVALLISTYTNQRCCTLVESLPVAVLLLTPLFFQAALWACAVLEHLWVMVFVLMVLFLETRRSWPAKFIQLLCISLAVATQGNGFLVLPILSIIRCKNGRYTSSGIFAVLAVLVASLYVENLPPSSSSLRLDLTLHKTVYYTVIFLGSGLVDSPSLAALIGALFLMLNLIAAYRSQQMSTQIILGCSVFVVLTAGLNALARSHLGVTYPLSQSRYAFPANIFVASSYLAYLGTLRHGSYRSSISQFALVCSVVFSFSAYRQIQPWLTLYSNTVKNSATHWIIGKAGLEYPDEDRARHLLLQLQELSAFTPPRYTTMLQPREVIEATLKQPCKTAKGRLVVEHFAVGEDLFSISGFVKQPAFKARERSFQLLISTPSNATGYLVTPLLQPRPDLQRGKRRERSFSQGFFAVVDKRQLNLKEISFGALLGGVEGCQIIPASDYMVNSYLFTNYTRSKLP